MKNHHLSPVLSSSFLWVPTLAASLVLTGGVAGCSSSAGGTGGGESSTSSSSSSGASSSSSGSSSSSSGGAAVTWTADAAPIFVAHCGGCHGGANPAGGNAFPTVYSDTQVAPNTTIAADCTGVTTVGACTLVRIKDGEMPYMAGCTGTPATDSANAACLNATEQATLQSWISGGEEM